MQEIIHYYDRNQATRSGHYSRVINRSRGIVQITSAAGDRTSVPYESIRPDCQALIREKLEADRALIKAIAKPAVKRTPAVCVELSLFDEAME